MRRIKKGDQVIVIAGKDKGRKGAVLSVLSEDKLLVEGVNLVRKHQRPNPMKGVTGGIVEKAMPIHSSNAVSYTHLTLPTKA